MRVAEKLDWKGLKIKKSVGNRKIGLERVKIKKSVGNRKIGLERVKDQEKRREEENHNVGRSDVGSEMVNIL
jgi:hypothetical protein